MKTSKFMQKVITQIAEKHRLDINGSQSHLRLEQCGYMPLVIEKVEKNLISVAHYFYQNGDAIADPDVVFFTGYMEWVPIEITQSYGMYQRCAELNDDGTCIEKFAPRAQAELASFCNQWARNIKEQCWLEHGVANGGDDDD